MFALSPVTLSDELRRDLQGDASPVDHLKMCVEDRVGVSLETRLRTQSLLENPRLLLTLKDLPVLVYRSPTELGDQVITSSLLSQRLNLVWVRTRSLVLNLLHSSQVKDFLSLIGGGGGGCGG